MYFCEKLNFTVAVYAVYFNNYLYVENNICKGLLGRHYQRYVESKKGFPFNCKFIALEKIGEKLENGKKMKCI